MADYTTIVGVDDKHWRQLQLVWPTWIRHKPSLLRYPMIIFVDRGSLVAPSTVKREIQHPDLQVVPWPPEPGIEYPGDPNTKFYHPQRYKMLAGFVHIAGMMVTTDYWLKLDTDAVAMGNNNWIDDDWFSDNPAIVAQPWGFTKPPDQMLRLDRWVKELGPLIQDPLLTCGSPLALHPDNPRSERLSHHRICSWCAFFQTDMSIRAAKAASTMGKYQLPVASQDGYHWYYAQRSGLLIKRVNMKQLGWEVWATDHNVQKAVERSLGATHGRSIS